MGKKVCYTPYTFSVKAFNAYVERSFDKEFVPGNATGIKKEGDAFFYQGEMHDYWEVVYVESGKLTVSEDDKIYELSQGQIIFHAPMEFHRFWAKETDFPVNLKIFSFSLDSNVKHNLSKGVFTLQIDKREQFREITEDVKNNYYSGNWVECEENEISPVEELKAIKKFENFLLELISENSPDRTLNAKASAKRYIEVVTVLKENVEKNLTVDEISKLSHLSVTYIKRLFNMYAGCGVMQYFIKLKVVKGMKYLKEGMSVSEVAEKLAFSSINYFSTVFKKETGISPLKYAKGDD